MVSALASERIGSRLFLHAYDHDPGATTAIVCSPDGGANKRSFAIALAEAFGVLVKPTVVGGNGITKVEIVAADDAAMTTNLTVVKDSGAIQADALDDQVFLECLASEVRQLSDAGGFNLQYVAARITMATATDEASVVYVGFSPRYPRTGLTATAIA